MVSERPDYERGTATMSGPAELLVGSITNLLAIEAGDSQRVDITPGVGYIARVVGFSCETAAIVSGPATSGQIRWECWAGNYYLHRLVSARFAFGLAGNYPGCYYGRWSCGPDTYDAPTSLLPTGLDLLGQLQMFRGVEFDDGNMFTVRLYNETNKDLAAGGLIKLLYVRRKVG